MNFRTLGRYSKPRRPGDQTSGGRGKLLRATTALTRIELLIRETLQNSWDARNNALIPTYGVRVDRLDEHRRGLLRHNVFTDLPDSLALIRESLRASGVHVLEIYDRGTSGLDGPFRASEEAPEGMPNNFNSFVFDIGTTSASEISGGTYGFGKTATFEVSRAHSVVYWSRCRNSRGVLEHRLIASALHDDYAESGKRYTGAHWWGIATEDDVLPLRGDDAEALGRELFQTGFGSEETGTSILIIDPEISFAQGGESDVGEREPIRCEAHVDAVMEQIGGALGHSAWPKTIPTDGVNSPMIIELYGNDESQNVASTVRNRYSRWADALMQVRKAQGQQSGSGAEDRPAGILREVTEKIVLRPRPSLNASREDVFGERTDRVAGHLHLVASIDPQGPKAPVGEKNKLCMMRSTAELVVRYDEVVDTEDDYIQWHGVFKPTPECDPHFAAAEPSTHDSWTPMAAEKEVSTYVVEKTLLQIRSKTRKFLAENSREQKDGEQSVRQVALALRSFMPSGDLPDAASAQDSRRSPTRRSRNTKETAKSSLEVISSEALATGLGQKLTIRPRSRSGAGRVMAAVVVYAKTSEGKMLLNDDEISIIWCVDGAHPTQGAQCELDAGERVGLTLRTRSALALEIDLKAEPV